jgi:hypothetical protein
MITDGLGINLRESLALFVMLRGLRVLAQGASLLNGPEFDLLAFFQDSLAGPDVDVLRGLDCSSSHDTSLCCSNGRTGRSQPLDRLVGNSAPA